jgi:hypothetical protein
MGGPMRRAILAFILYYALTPTPSRANDHPTVVAGDANFIVLDNGDNYRREAGGAWTFCGNIILGSGDPGGRTRLVGSVSSLPTEYVGSDGTFYSGDCNGSGPKLFNIFDRMGVPRDSLVFASGNYLSTICQTAGGDIIRGASPSGGDARIWTNEGNVFAGLLGVGSEGSPGHGSLVLSVTSPARALCVNVHLSAPSPISIEVFDLSGRRVGRRWASELPAGGHTLRLSPFELGTDVRPGVYRIRVTTPSGTGSATWVMLQ